MLQSIVGDREVEPLAGGARDSDSGFGLRVTGLVKRSPLTADF